MVLTHYTVDVIQRLHLSLLLLLFSSKKKKKNNRGGSIGVSESCAYAQYPDEAGRHLYSIPALPVGRNSTHRPSWFEGATDRAGTSPLCFALTICHFD